MMRVSSYRKVICSVLAILLLCNLSSCMLLPEEEVTRKVSLVKTEVLEPYHIISPVRQDFEKVMEIPCTYKQLKEKGLRFKLKEVPFAGIYVTEGQYVKKGTLLANLQVKELTDEIKALKSAISQEKQIISKAKERAAFEKRKVEIDYKFKNITKAERNQSISEIENSLKSEIGAAGDQVVIDELRLKEKKTMEDGSKIYAPYDGIITFVKEFTDETYSRKDEDVIKIVDPKQCAFEVMTTENVSFIKEGQTYHIECGNISYKGVVMPIKKKDSKTIFLKVKDAPASLYLETQGMIRHFVEKRKNVLVLPKEVIYDDEDGKYVYLLNKDKVKVMNKVKLGLETAAFAEITDGLKEDDLVIK